MALQLHTCRPPEAPDCAGRKKMGAPPIDHRQDVGEVQTVSGRDQRSRLIPASRQPNPLDMHPFPVARAHSCAP